MSLVITPPTSFLTTDDQMTGLFPMSSELTVSQAAKLIDVKEGYINELLDAGFVTFRLKNGKRLVRRDSLLEHEAEYQEGLKGLAEITRMSQEMGLYD